MAGIGVTRVADCPVCLGTFKDPRFLPCGHTFCLRCITEHGRSKGSDPDCPNCRTKFQIPSNGFESLPKNYSLNSVLNETIRVVYGSKAKVTTRSCKKHSEEPLIRYCLQCNELICLDCMDEDHHQHDCCKINRFANEARMQLEGYVNSIKPILYQVTSQKAQLQEKSQKFCDLLDVTELAINEEYEKNKRILDDHRCLLLEELSNEKQSVTKDLKMKSDEIETEQLSLASFKTRIEEMLQGTDEETTFDIVYQYKDFKDIFQKLKQTQPLTMGHVSITGVEFIPGDFKDLISRRRNTIGRLQKESDEMQPADNFGVEQASATDRVGSFTFKTHSGLTVHVSKGNLVHQSLDAIVNPANEHLSNEGGAARAIAKAAGVTLQRECNEYIRKDGKLEIASVMHTTAGNLQPKIKYVIHTVGPRDSDGKDDEELLALVRLAVFNCINYANEHLKIRSLAIPAISSGIFGVPIEIVGRASFEALTKFEEYCALSKNNTVREIHFLNMDELTFSNVKRIFQSMITQESSVGAEQPVHALSRLDQGKLEDELAEAKQEILRLHSQLRLQSSSFIDQSVMTQSNIGQSFSPPSDSYDHKMSLRHPDPVRSQRDCEKLKEKLMHLPITGRSLDIVMQYVNIYSCHDGDVSLFLWNSELGHYLAYLATDVPKHFLHADCVGLIDSLDSDLKEAGKWIIAEVVSRDFCMAKKVNNRLRVPIGTKFYRVKIKPWTAGQSSPEALTEEDQLTTDPDEWPREDRS